MRQGSRAEQPSQELTLQSPQGMWGAAARERGGRGTQGYLGEESQKRDKNGFICGCKSGAGCNSVLGGLLEPIPGSVHTQDGQGLEQPAQVKSVPVHVRGVGMR